MDGTTHLAVAELVIYSPVALIAHYLTFKHGKRGLDGWLFSVAFVFYALLRLLSESTIGAILTMAGQCPRYHQS
jgi:hypothetical protein